MDMFNPQSNKENSKHIIRKQIELANQPHNSTKFIKRQSHNNHDIQDPMLSSTNFFNLSDSLAARGPGANSPIYNIS